MGLPTGKQENQRQSTPAVVPWGDVPEGHWVRVARFGDEWAAGIWTQRQRPRSPSWYDVEIHTGWGDTPEAAIAKAIGWIS